MSKAVSWGIKWLSMLGIQGGTNAKESQSSGVRIFLLWE
jgi:hypothetical protein